MTAIVPRRLLLRGPVLIGFNELFDESSGRPTDQPLPKITPSSIGGVLVPFECPECETVCPETVHAKTRLDYRDDRGFSWCPACRTRYVIDEKGAPLADELEVGAASAPALVERCGKVALVGGPKQDGLNVLGAVS